jgi:hypothetical protein
MFDVDICVRESINEALGQSLGIEKNWFNIVVGQAARRTRGQDMFDVATEAANEIILSLATKDDAFWDGIAPLIDSGDDDQLSAYFTNAAALRVRRLAGRYQRRRDGQTVAMSTLEGEDGKNWDAPGRPESAVVIADVVAAIVEELGTMSQRAKDPRTARRLLLAQEVAEKRLENPPEVVGLDTLLTLFPDVKHTTMNTIIGDIQAAWSAVNEREEIAA